MFSRGGKRRPQALRVLAKKELGLDIQSGEHSSVDDARAALYLYHKVGWPVGGRMLQRLCRHAAVALHVVSVLGGTVKSAETSCPAAAAACSALPQTHP